MSQTHALENKENSYYFYTFFFLNFEWYTYFIRRISIMVMPVLVRTFLFRQPICLPFGPFFPFPVCICMRTYLGGTRLTPPRENTFLAAPTLTIQMNFNSVLYFLLFCLLFHCFDFITHFGLWKVRCKSVCTVCVCVFGMYGVVEGAGWGRFPIFRCSRTQFFQAQHAPKSSHELKASGKLQTRAAGKAENREASNVNANPLYEECVILEGPNLLEKRGSRSRALTLSLALLPLARKIRSHLFGTLLSPAGLFSLLCVRFDNYIPPRKK